MARIYRNIVQSKVEPQDKEVIWIKSGNFYHFNNGSWTPLHLPDVEALKYIRVGEGYNINNIKEALDALFEECAKPVPTDKVIDSTTGKDQTVLNYKFGKTSETVETITKINLYSKGRFSTLEELVAAYPSPSEGSYAYIGTQSPYAIYLYTSDKGWYDSGETYEYINYKIEILPEELLEALSKQGLLQDDVIYLGTEEE